MPYSGRPTRSGSRAFWVRAFWVLCVKPSWIRFLWHRLADQQHKNLLRNSVLISPGRLIRADLPRPFSFLFFMYGRSHSKTKRFVRDIGKFGHQAGGADRGCCARVVKSARGLSFFLPVGKVALWLWWSSPREASMKNCPSDLMCVFCDTFSIFDAVPACAATCPGGSGHPNVQNVEKLMGK